jgi:NAD(P) transhydrogenase subunit alpha
MTADFEVGLYIFLLAGFLGFHIISRVPPLLHTPLMSATNALSGISLIGSMVVAGSEYSRLSTLLGFIAVACSATNVVGGFLITDRMLGMFRSEHQGGAASARLPGYARVAAAGGVSGLAGALCWLGHRHGIDALRYLYLVSAVLFILGLKGLSSPRYARPGMSLAAVGMMTAVAGTLFHGDLTRPGYVWVGVGLALGPSSAGRWGCESQ